MNPPLPGTTRPEGRRNSFTSVSAHRAVLGRSSTPTSEGTSSHTGSSSESSFNLADKVLLPLQAPNASRYTHLRGADLQAKYEAMDVIAGWEHSSDATLERFEDAYERAKTRALEEGTLDDFLEKPVLVCALSRHGRLEGVCTSLGGQRFAQGLAQERKETVSCRMELDPYRSGRWPARRQYIRDTGEVKNHLKDMARNEMPRKLTVEEIAEFQDIILQTLHAEHLGIEVRGMNRDHAELARYAAAKRALALGESSEQLEADARLPAHENQENGMLDAINDDLDHGRSVILAHAGPAHGPLFHDRYADRCTVLTVAHFAGLTDEEFDSTLHAPHMASRMSYCFLHPEFDSFKGAEDAPLTSDEFQQMVRSLGLTDVASDAAYASSDALDTDEYLADSSSAADSEVPSAGSGNRRGEPRSAEGSPRRPASPVSSGSDVDSALGYGSPPPRSSSSEIDSDLAYPSPGSDRSS